MNNVLEGIINDDSITIKIAILILWKGISQVFLEHELIKIAI
jgi:hypothetical protein